MPCEILKLCEYYAFHKEGEVTITIGALRYEGKLYVSLCRKTPTHHAQHIDLIGPESLIVVEKISRALRLV